MDKLILLGKILSPHGVRGEVKVLSFAEIAYNLVSYGPLYNKAGSRRFKLTLRGQTKDGFIASVEGIANRDDAEKIRNTELYIPRSALPEASQGQYYQNDLIGMQIITDKGSSFGMVGAFHNFGAGTLIDIRFPDGKSELFSFTKANFPNIDIHNRTVTIVIPETIE